MADPGTDQVTVALILFILALGGLAGSLLATERS